MSYPLYERDRGAGGIAASDDWAAVDQAPWRSDLGSCGFSRFATIR
jgi:hypothetical protein